jgi:lantibiotic modifying enzyme
MGKKLRKIADYLLLRSSYMQDIGFFHGKMGVTVALYMYSSKYGDKLMEEYAWDLFQQVYDCVHTDMPVGIENGLAGIGYGTTLLCRHGLVECDLNEVLTDVDAKIMERDPRRMSDLSFRTGLEGLLQYILLRQSTGEPLLTFDSQYLTEFNSVLARSKQINSQPCNLIGKLLKPQFAIGAYTENALGIDAGCAYYILNDYLTNGKQ